MRVPRLETERLVVRELQPADDIAGVLGEAREDWLRWTIDSYHRHAELRQPPYGERGVALRDGGRLVGLVGLVPSLGPFRLLPSLAGGAGDPRRFTPEVGLFWETAPDQRGNGFAPEAAASLIRWAFAELHLQRVVATTEHDNLASIAVMRKLGMRIEANPGPEPPWFQTVGILEAGSVPPHK